jgi:hypothetical protein
MNDFNKPIRPVKRIQESSERKDISLANSSEDRFHEKKNTRKGKSYSFVYKLNCIKDFFKKIVGFSIQTQDPDLFTTKDLLLNLKKHLIDIGEKNPTNHPDFVLSLASTWKELLEALQQHPSSKGQLLIDSFKTYPGRTTYSLHFYLTRFSGKEWFPLPFFELLQILHQDYRRSQKNCQIDRWTHLIDDILSSPASEEESY